MRRPRSRQGHSWVLSPSWPGLRIPLIRQAIVKALCRLYQREAEWDGKWWGTRPDTSGPYFKPETWEKSEAIRRVLSDTLGRGDATMLRWFLPELIRNKIDINEATTEALKLAAHDPALRATTVELLSGRANLSGAAVGVPRRRGGLRGR